MAIGPIYLTSLFFFWLIKWAPHFTFDEFGHKNELKGGFLYRHLQFYLCITTSYLMHNIKNKKIKKDKTFTFSLNCLITMFFFFKWSKSKNIIRIYRIYRIYFILLVIFQGEHYWTEATYFLEKPCLNVSIQKWYISLLSNISLYISTFTFMHLADAFIQSDLHCIQVTVFFYILSALAFPGNQTHDLGVASAMLYHLSYRKDL